MKAAGFFSLATSKCPPGSSTIPSPRDPCGSDHARAISPRPSTVRSIDATTFNASGSMSSTPAAFPGAAKRARGRQRRQPRSGSHAWEASNLRASRCSSYANRFGPHRCAAGKTRRSWPPGRRRRLETSDRFGRDASKYQRPREVARRPRGTLEAGSCLTYRFPPWERVSAHIKENVHGETNSAQSFLVRSTSVSRPSSNGAVWRVYNVHFGQPIEKILVCEVDLIALSPKSDEILECFGNPSREGFSKGKMADLLHQKQS